MIFSEKRCTLFRITRPIDSQLSRVGNTKQS